MNQKAFSLVELLAVILVLAVVALISVPIVLNVIKDTEEKSNIESAKAYLKAVTLAIENRNLDGRFNPTECNIQTNGNIKCGEEPEIKVKTEKAAAKGGKITLKNWKIVSIDGLNIKKSFYDYSNGTFELLHKYKIKFDTNGGSGISNQDILTHRKVQEPTIPTKEGYVFQGWQLNNQDYDFDTPITQDITLEAKWETLIIPKFYSALSTLPSGYQQVDYIQSTGTQYINTGYKPSGTNHPTKIVADAKFNSVGSAMGLWGECTTTTYANLFGFWSSANGQWGFARFKSGGYSVFFGNVDTNRHIFTFEYNVGMSIDDIIAQDTVEMASDTLSDSKNLVIFARNFADTITQYSNLNLYSFKIYDDANLSMLLIPCYRTSDSKAGLYDTVSNTFFPNNGSGNFNMGFKEIETEYQYKNVIPSAPEVSGYSFVEWNTLPDGSGISYSVGDTILYSDIMSDEVDLYAIYEVEI